MKDPDKEWSDIYFAVQELGKQMASSNKMMYILDEISSYFTNNGHGPVHKFAEGHFYVDRTDMYEFGQPGFIQALDTYIYHHFPEGKLIVEKLLFELTT